MLIKEYCELQSKEFLTIVNDALELSSSSNRVRLILTSMREQLKAILLKKLGESLPGYHNVLAGVDPIWNKLDINWLELLCDETPSPSLQETVLKGLLDKTVWLYALLCGVKLNDSTAKIGFNQYFNALMAASVIDARNL
jgi:hypothetical protein